MTNKPSPHAEAAFKASQQREQTVKDIIEKERAAVAAKSAKLKALRLAKEASDREAAAIVPRKPKAGRRKALPQT